MNNEYKSRRSFIIIAAIAILVIIFVAFFARHGFVIVSSTSKLSLSIHDDNGKEIATNTTHYVSFASTGTYIANGSLGKKATARYYTVHPFSFQQVTLVAAKTAIDSSPVTNYANIESIQSTKNSLRFFDNSSHTIRAITSNNQISAVNSQKFSNINWAPDGKSAIAISNSDSSKLYVIQNNIVSPLQLPKTIQNPDSVSAAIAANGRVFIAIDNQLFTAQNTRSDYQRISTIDKNTTITSAANKTVLLTRYNSNGAENFSYKLIAMTIDGASASYTIAVNYTVALSPDGTKVFMAVHGRLGAVYDSNFHKLYKIPSTKASTVGWINNHTVTYAAGENIWTYDQDTKSANEIASMPTTYQYIGIKSPSSIFRITNLSVDQSSHAIYYTASDTMNSTIYRVNTSSKQIDNSAESIGLTAVTTFPNFCTAYYVNVTKPTFYIYGAIVPQDCVDAIKSYISAINIPLADVSIINT